MSTGFWSVHVAVNDVFFNDSALRVEAGVKAEKPYFVFNGLAPQGVLRPYIILGSTTENPFDLFARPGNEGVMTIVIHSASPGNSGIARFYAHINRLLDRVPLSLAGPVMVQGRTSLVLTFPTADGLAAQGVVEYRFITLS